MAQTFYRINPKCCIRKNATITNLFQLWRQNIHLNLLLSPKNGKYRFIAWKGETTFRIMTFGRMTVSKRHSAEQQLAELYHQNDMYQNDIVLDDTEHNSTLQE
jgi:hypothetical protein